MDKHDELRNVLAWAHSAPDVSALVARLDEIEVAIGQAVEFAEYVERQAKGSMADAAKRFLSLPYSQEVAARLKGAL